MRYGSHTQYLLWTASPSDSSGYPQGSAAYGYAQAPHSHSQAHSDALSVSEYASHPRREPAISHISDAPQAAPCHIFLP